MSVALPTRANEKSTYIVTVLFTDENDDAVSPNVPLTWSLIDINGAIVNNRDGVGITPATSVDIVLTGDDLAILPIDGGYVRRVLIEGTYDSDAGSDLPIKEEAKFTVQNLVGVS